MSRVFVTGAGRCGTLTFAKACEHVKGFTAAHESHAGRISTDYPEHHIEVDPHLLWIAPGLIERYPEARWVILERKDMGAHVRSLSARATMDAWARLAFQTRAMGTNRHDLGLSFWSFAEGALRAFLPKALVLSTPVPPSGWNRFLDYIDADATLFEPELILQKVHNESRA